MDEKDKQMKEALDDIFGDDVIEIKDTNDDNLTNTSLNIPNISSSEIIAPTSLDKEDNIQETTEKDNNISYKKIILYFLIGFVLGFILIYIIVNFVLNKEKTINCSYSANDLGYKITDEYKIKYKNNTILKVDGSYIYTAKTEEYKSQIEYIKNEKIPVIINSNGMKGFTYLYEVSDSYFKVNSYLVYDLFEFDKINKIDQKNMPISYFKITSDKSVKKLKNELINKGYTCNLSK